ncbi:MAG: hypothetical protein HQK51_00670 [Oligoflexia bacterium]|nr:hypothetical protein [Oligoflexia bacterium]
MKQLLNICLFFLFCVLLLSNSSNAAANNSSKSAPPSEETPIDFSTIKKIIKNDLLEDVVIKKNEIIQNNKKEQQRKKIETYRFPSIDDFWSFISEYWIIQNSSRLIWNFEKADYGIETSVQSIFENMGLYEVKFKILLVNSLSLYHFVLPSGNNECIFLLSFPLMRTLDLTKTEVALLILEDYFRLNQNYFKDYVYEKELDKFIGNNFYQKNFELSLINKVLKNYSYMIFEKGFSPQQQYEVTKRIAESIKTNSKLLVAYTGLLNKLDLLVKNNKDYRNYNKIYPTPEMQLKWLSVNSKDINKFSKNN